MSEIKQEQNDQQTRTPPINHAAVERSLLCFAVGQINIHITCRFPDRPAIKQLDWTHWTFAGLLVAYGGWNVWWLIQSSIRHYYTDHRADAVLMFGLQFMLSLSMLEWGLWKPRRKARFEALEGNQSVAD